MWVTIAFGSPVFIYSTLFWEHTPATCLTLGGALLIVREAVKEGVRNRGAAWMVGALMLGGAAYLRLETVLFSAALLAACWLVFKQKHSRVLLAALTLVVVMLPYRYLHQATFEGQPMPANARYLNLPLAHVRTVGWRAIPDLLVGPPEEEGIDAGRLGGLWTVAAIVAVAASWVPRQIGTARGLKLLGLALSGGAAAYFLITPTPFRAAHGLLFTTPWALVGFTRAREVWATGSPRMRVIVGTVILGLGAYTLAILGVRASSPQGGLEWGARFALTFYPLLALIVGWSWQSQPRFERVLIILLIVLGIGFQARGLMTIRQDKLINAALNRAIGSLPEEHVLTDLWWLALNAAPIHEGPAIYSMKSPGEGAVIVTKASEHGLDHVAMVTLEHGMPAHIDSHLRNQGSPLELKVLELIQVGDLLIYRLQINFREEGVLPFFANAE
jgi:multisubunit Na+/H+ antiporter MnhB subunit